MPEVIETIVYAYDELSPAAQEAAKDWYRDTAPSHGWWEPVYEDFAMICACLGIQLKTRNTARHSQPESGQPCVWFSGFWTQGDGACFEATWAYARGASLAVRAYAPQDCKLHGIADRLQEIQRRNIYQLVADIDHQGRYCHEGTMVITVERDSHCGQAPTHDAEEAVTDAMRDLACWLYRQLEAEYDDITSDSAVKAAIIANAYTFTVSGRRFG